MTLSDNPNNASPLITSTTLLTQSFEVNFVQTTAPKTSQQPKGKKKNNNNRHKKNYSTEPTRQPNQEYNDGGSKGLIGFKYPCIVCPKDHMTKYYPCLLDVCNYVKQGQSSSQCEVPTNPFPAPQKMVSQVPSPLSGASSSSSNTILMVDMVFGISKRAKNYVQLEGSSATKATPSTSQPDRSLTLDIPTIELPSCTSKVTSHQTRHNFKTQATQHYSIVQDLIQAPCAMSSLEVLQSCPT